MNSVFRCVAALATMTLIVACQDSNDSGGTDASSVFVEAPILEFVPADTPYLYASVAPVPEETYAALRPRIDGLLSVFSQAITMAIEIDESRAAEGEDVDLVQASLDDELQFGPEETDEPLDDNVKALLRKFQSYLSSAALEEIGLDRNALTAIYGNGFKPVLRMRSSKPSMLRATIDSFMADAGIEMESEQIGQQSYGALYWEDWALLMATIESDLVITILAADAELDEVAEALGLSLPAEDLASSGRLAQIAADGNYLPYGLGYLDIRKAMNLLVESDTALPIDDITELLTEEDGLSAACRTELLEVADAMPLYRFGVTELTGDRIEAEYLLELRPDLATSLAAITAPVPALNEDMGGLFFVGLSFDLFAARDFALERIRALEADPFECEGLVLVQELILGSKEVIEGNMPPMVSSMKGFAFALDDVGEFDMQNPEATSFSGRVVAAMDNPLSMLAMGGMAVPALASVPLQDDGKATQLPEGSIPYVDGPIFLAVAESAVAMTIGSDDGAAAEQLLAGSPADVPPLYAYGIDMTAMMDFMLQVAQSTGEPLTAEEQVAQEFFKVLGALDLRYVEAMRFAEEGAKYNVTLSFE